MHWLAPKVSLIVFDEAHQSVAPTFRLPVEIVLNMNPDCKFLGLTATPGRTWDDIDEDMVLSNFYNNKKVTLEIEGYDTAIHYLVDQGYLSKTQFKRLDYDEIGTLEGADFSFMDEGREIPKAILDKIAGDGMRNARIIEKIQELVNQGHDRVLVFGINVPHAQELSSFLNFIGIQSECITSATEDYPRKRAIADFKTEGGDPRVLCNYGVLTTGFDAPKTSAAIIARPTNSLVLYSQMVGRVIRGPKVKGTEEAVIWTVVDTNLPGFDSIPGAFTNWDDVW
jgi:superfamily II DNA or RNA helicase